MKFIYRVIPLILVAMLLGCSSSSSKYEEQRENSDEKGIAIPNSETWEKEKSGQRRNSVAELSEDDRQTVHEEWQI